MLCSGQTAAASASWGEALLLSDDLQGPSHPATLSLRRQHALLLLETGRLQEAGDSLRANLPLIERRYGAASPEAAAAWDALGQVSYELGDLDRAHDQFLRATRILRTAKVPPSSLADTLQRDAAVLIEARRAQSALRMLQDVGRLRGQANPDDLRLQAEARLQLGDVATALEALEAARMVAPNNAELRNLQARLVLVDATRDDAARADAMTTLEAAAANTPDNRLQPRRLHAQLWLAEARCIDSPEAAQATFDSLESALTETQPQGGALSRRVREARTACPAPAPAATSTSTAGVPAD